MHYLDDRLCPWPSFGQPSILATLASYRILALPIAAHPSPFGPQGHNYSHLVPALSHAPLALFGQVQSRDRLYGLWPGYDSEASGYFLQLALVLAMEQTELERLTSEGVVPRLIRERPWLQAVAGDSPLLTEQGADPNDSAEVFTHRLLVSQAGLPVWQNTNLATQCGAAMRRALRSVPVAQAVDFWWFQVLATVNTLRSPAERRRGRQWGYLLPCSPFTVDCSLYSRLAPGINMYKLVFAKGTFLPSWFKCAVPGDKRPVSHAQEGSLLHLCYGGQRAKGVTYRVHLRSYHQGSALRKS